MTPAPPHPVVSFTITAEDYANALRLYMRRYWASRIGPKLFVAAVFTVCLSTMILTNFDPLWTSVGTGAMIGGAGMPVLAYIVLLPRRARKIYGQQKTMRKPVDASWSKEGFTASSVDATGTTLWSDYHGWSVDKTMVLLMHSEALFQMLPRHALNGEQADDLVAHLEASGLRRI